MPLEDLVVDENSLDRELLATALQPYLRIGSGGQPRPTERYGDLSQRGKVIALLLAMKAARVLEMRPAESVNVAEVKRLSGIAPGTVGRVLRELAADHLVAQDSSGAYFVPSMTVPAAIKEMQRARA